MSPALTNQQIAAVIADIAAMLDIEGENPFKVRAYERAAQVIASLSEEVSSLRARGALKGIPGIGAGIASKIEELLDKGTCDLCEELKQKIPPGVLEMLRIREVGPKTVAVLYHRLGIDSIDALEKAAREGRLRTVKGFGPKTEGNLLKGIERMRQRTSRFSLADAYPHALGIMQALKKSCPIDQIEVAGSLRRFCETIGDIDILVTSTDAGAVMEAFTSLPVVREIVAKGDTKSSVLTDLGIQVDVRVVDPSEFGAALQYFTGSKAHNVKLRELAVRRGLKLSEYGVFRVKGNKRLGGATEEEMYAALRLPLIPVEMREDLGEVELAVQGKLPSLIEPPDIKGDLQSHTRESDGNNTLEQMAAAARERGYEYLLITDHSRSSAYAGGLSEERLRKQMRQIKALNKKLKRFTLLAGTEVDIKSDGRLDFPDSLLSQLDIVVASIHSGFKMDSAAMTKRIIAALQNPYVDVLGHPTGRLIGERDPYDVDIEAVLTEAARLGVAVELNAQPQRLDLNDVHCRRARELGVLISIGTDAHGTDQLEFMHYGVATAGRAWLEPKHVLNTRPLKELLSWRKARIARRLKRRA
jgi:DNA polymerase (family 10)